MQLETSLTGDKELDKTFMRLPRSSQRKAYMPALRAGAVPVRDAARANIRAVSEPYSGVARQAGSIRIYNLRKNRGNFRVAVTVKRGLLNPAKKDKNGKPVRVGMYLAVLEYGSQKLNRAPRPWLRKAQREQQGKAVMEVKQEFFKRLDDVIADARGRL